MKELLTTAANVLLPKGDGRRMAMDAYVDVTGQAPPEFAGEELATERDGQSFWLLRGRDIPEFTARGLGEVGLTSTDARREFMLQRPGNYQRLRYERVSQAVCRFSLLALAEDVEGIMRQLERFNSRPLQVATSRPELLANIAASGDLSIIPAELPVTGSVEALVKLANLPLAADIVDTGETAAQNGLVEVYPLMNIYAEIVAGAGV